MNAALVLLVGVAGCSAGGLSPGPLDPPNRHLSKTVRAVGQTFTDGFEVISVPPGVERLRLVSLEPVGDEELELVGWKVADEHRAIGAVQYLPWPPRGHGITAKSQHPGPGYEVDLGERPVLYESGLELLMGIRPTRLGYLQRRGFHLTYEADGERHRVFFDAGLYVCSEEEAPTIRRQSDCPDPEQMGFPPHFGP